MNGQRVYVGITNDSVRSAKEHGTRFDYLEVLNLGEPIQRRQARGIETSIINSNSQFQNKGRSIWNYRKWYNSAMKWAGDWLEDED